MDSATTVITGETQSLPSSLGIVTPSDNSTNVTLWPACYLNQEIPKTKDLLKVIIQSPVHLAVMLVALLLVFCTMVMYLEGQLYLIKKIPGRRKVHLSFIFSLYPVFSATSLCGFFIPKAHIVAKFTSEIWLSLVLFQFVLLVSEYFGSREKMLNMLHGVKIPLAGPPCLCCCCCCLPSVLISGKNVDTFVRRVKILVLQVAVLRPIMWFIAIILWINGNYNEGAMTVGDAYPYMTVLSVISNMAGLQALVTLFKIAQDPLSSYKIKPKFFTVQFVLIITSIQSLVTGTLAKFGVIKCFGPFNPRVNERLILNFAVIVEMFFFMMLAAWWYRRVEGNVDHDLLERQSYKRLSRAHYKKNPADQIILREADPPINGEIAMQTLPNNNEVSTDDSIWRQRETNGKVDVKNTRAAAGTGTHSTTKAGKPHKDFQKEPLLTSNSMTDEKAVCDVILSQPTFPIDKFASSRETDV